MRILVLPKSTKWQVICICIWRFTFSNFFSRAGVILFIFFGKRCWLSGMYSDPPRSRTIVSIRLRWPASKAACSGVVFWGTLKKAAAPAHCKKLVMSGQLALTATTIYEVNLAIVLSLLFPSLVLPFCQQAFHGASPSTVFISLARSLRSPLVYRGKRFRSLFSCREKAWGGVSIKTQHRILKITSS